MLKLLLLYLLTDFSFLVYARKNVICYYRNWALNSKTVLKLNPEEIDASLCDIISVAFMRIDMDTLTIKEVGRGDANIFNRLNALKLRNPNLKLFALIGGWNHERLPRFSRMVETAESRNRFIESLLNFIREHRLDGITYDWLYPNKRPVRPPDTRDVEKFNILLEETLNAFRVDAKNRNTNRYQLSVAVSGHEGIITSSYDVPKIAELADWVEVIMHSFWGPWKKVTGSPTAMTGDTPTLPQSLQMWLMKGMPRNKIHLGISAYGRTYELTGENQYGLGAAVSGPGAAGLYTREKGVLSYFEICNDPWTHKTSWYKSGTMTPFASRGNLWVGYDSLQSIKFKLEQLVIKYDLKGATVWALDLDDFGGLCNEGMFPVLNVVHEVLSNASAIITATSKSTTTTEKTKPVTHAPLRHVTTTAVGAAGRRGRVLTQSIKATTEDVSREGETCKNRLDHITCLYYVKLGYCYTQSSLNYMRQFCCAACKDEGYLLTTEKPTEAPVIPWNEGGCRFYVVIGYCYSHYYTDYNNCFCCVPCQDKETEERMKITHAPKSKPTRRRRITDRHVQTLPRLKTTTRKATKLPTTTKDTEQPTTPKVTELITTTKSTKPPTATKAAESSTNTKATEPPTTTKATEPPTTTGPAEPPTTKEATEPPTTTKTTEPPTTTEGTKPPTRTKATTPPTPTKATEPPTTTKATEPPTTTKPSEPLTTTEATEPSTTTKATEPSTTTEATEPLTTTKATELLTTSKATKPATTTIVTEPPTMTDATEPPPTIKATEPSTTTKTTEPPTTTKATEPPTTTEATEPPTTTETPEQPTTTKATEPPTTTKATEPITTTEDTKPPTTAKATEPPITTIATESPTTTKANEAPTTTLATEPPTTTKITEPPTTTKATEPTTTTKTTEPQTTSKAIKPQATTEATEPLTTIEATEPPTPVKTTKLLTITRAKEIITDDDIETTVSLTTEFVITDEETTFPQSPYTDIDVIETTDSTLDKIGTDKITFTDGDKVDSVTTVKPVVTDAEKVTITDGYKVDIVTTAKPVVTDAEKVTVTDGYKVDVVTTAKPVVTDDKKVPVTDGDKVDIVTTAKPVVTDTEKVTVTDMDKVDVVTTTKPVVTDTEKVTVTDGDKVDIVTTVKPVVTDAEKVIITDGDRIKIKTTQEAKTKEIEVLTMMMLKTQVPLTMEEQFKTTTTFTLKPVITDSRGGVIITDEIYIPDKKTTAPQTGKPIGVVTTKTPVKRTDPVEKLTQPVATKETTVRSTAKLIVITDVDSGSRDITTTEKLSVTTKLPTITDYEAVTTTGLTTSEVETSVVTDEEIVSTKPVEILTERTTTEAPHIKTDQVTWQTTAIVTYGTDVVKTTTAGATDSEVIKTATATDILTEELTTRFVEKITDKQALTTETLTEKPVDIITKKPVVVTDDGTMTTVKTTEVPGVTDVVTSQVKTDGETVVTDDIIIVTDGEVLKTTKATEVITDQLTTNIVEVVTEKQLKTTAKAITDKEIDTTDSPVVITDEGTVVTAKTTEVPGVTDVVTSQVKTDGETVVTDDIIIVTDGEVVKTTKATEVITDQLTSKIVEVVTEKQPETTAKAITDKEIDTTDSPVVITDEGTVVTAKTTEVLVVTDAVTSQVITDGETIVTDDRIIVTDGEVVKTTKATEVITDQLTTKIVEVVTEKQPETTAKAITDKEIDTTDSPVVITDERTVVKAKTTEVPVVTDVVTSQVITDGETVVTDERIIVTDGEVVKTTNTTEVITDQLTTMIVEVATEKQPETTAKAITDKEIVITESPAVITDEGVVATVKTTEVPVVTESKSPYVKTGEEIIVTTEEITTTPDATRYKTPIIITVKTEPTKRSTAKRTTRPATRIVTTTAKACVNRIDERTCVMWAKVGNCDNVKYKNYMRAFCCRSCQDVVPKPTTALPTTTTTTTTTTTATTTKKRPTDVGELITTPRSEWLTRPKECVDIYQHNMCVRWITYGYCNYFIQCFCCQSCRGHNYMYEQGYSNGWSNGYSNSGLQNYNGYYNHQSANNAKVRINQAGCVNLGPDEICEDMVGWGYCNQPQKRFYMNRYCCASCRAFSLRPKTTTTTATTTTTTTTTTTPATTTSTTTESTISRLKCRDRTSHPSTCDDWVLLGYCRMKRYIGYMRFFCCASCKAYSGVKW